MELWEYLVYDENSLENCGYELYLSMGFIWLPHSFCWKNVKNRVVDVSASSLIGTL